MRRKCPMCGSLFHSHCTQRDGRSQFLTLNGGELILHEDRLHSITQVEIAPPKDAQLSQWQASLLRLLRKQNRRLLRLTLLNGPASQSSRSRKQSKGQRKERG